MQILITLPVTTATDKMSFSNLRHHKIYLRNTTGQVRLNDLVMLNIHCAIYIDSEMVVDEMAKTSKQKIYLIL